MVVTFRKLIEQRLVAWEAVRGTRARIPGKPMALGRPDRIPHDLAQIAVEATLGLDRGFWGSIAAGATFRSTQRKRTRDGRAVIARNRADLGAAEHIAGEHVARWAAGDPTPVAAALDDLQRRWADLPDGGGLTVEWPSLRVVATSPA